MLNRVLKELINVLTKKQEKAIGLPLQCVGRTYLDFKTSFD